jgi:hypothetical protein
MRLVFFVSIFLCETCFSQNPFITSIYAADPSAHVWADGRLYVYPSHDVDPARGCDLMDRYHVFSTDDMVNWRDEGEILKASQLSWGRKEGGFMWAPDCAYKNGTYYFYFPHPSGTEWNKTWKIGVAISKKPASDFKSIGYIEELSGNAMIDPCVFVDTDGKPYFYYGGGGVCKGGKLKDNMREIDGELQGMTGLIDFHEAAWVFKRNGIYYLTYADNNPRENQLRYATSSSPLGPWKYGGVYLGATGCDTNHGSVVEFKGNWYAFYHNKSLSNTGKGNLRSICVDLLNFNIDGTIQMVEQTKSGIASAGIKVSGTRKEIEYEAENATIGGNATIVNSTSASGGKLVTNFSSGDSYIEFDNIKGKRKGGRATVNIYHSGTSYSKIKLVVNGIDYSYLNAMPTSDPGDFKGHMFFTVNLMGGKNNIIKLIGGNGNINIDYITVCPID